MLGTAEGALDSHCPPFQFTLHLSALHKQRDGRRSNPPLICGQAVFSAFEMRSVQMHSPSITIFTIQTSLAFVPSACAASSGVVFTHEWTETRNAEPRGRHGTKLVRSGTGIDEIPCTSE